jgi:hypothetical protein
VRELDQRTAALEQSRRELLEASDSEKARFSTRLSRVVLPHLAPLPGLLADLGRRLSQAGTADEVVRSLAAAQEEASQSLEELRRLVRGLKVRVAPDGQRPVAAQATASRSGPNADFVR